MAAYRYLSLVFTSYFLAHYRSISKTVTNLYHFLAHMKGFLHRSADLTLVPSIAIAKDFETAKVLSCMWTTLSLM